MNETSGHDAWRELLALRLYGELDADETRALAGHLAGCAACRALARELDLGLGALQRPEPDALPDGWLEALDARVEALPGRRPLARTVLAFAAGAAAGLLVALSVTRSPESAPSRETVRFAGAGLVATNAEPLPRAPRSSDPPPRATSRGQLAELRLVLGR